MIDQGILGLMIVGSFIIGFIVMWIGFLFIAREKDFTASEYGGFITAFFGGAILTLLRHFHHQRRNGFSGFNRSVF